MSLVQQYLKEKRETEAGNLIYQEKNNLFHENIIIALRKTRIENLSLLLLIKSYHSYLKQLICDIFYNK